MSVNLNQKYILNYFFALFTFLVLGEGKIYSDFINVVTNSTVKLFKGRDAIIFGCDRKVLLDITAALILREQLVYPVRLSSNFTLNGILTRHNHARTSVLVDCSCNGSRELFVKASESHFFNKTYQWLLWDAENVGVDILLPTALTYPGLNSQITYVNRSDNFEYIFWDIHSKGRHLGSALEFNSFATYNETEGLHIHGDINEIQGIRFRDQFKGLLLRGATVIDQDNITTNEQIEEILSRPVKDAGVAPFVKYHYDLLNLLRFRLNFTVNFRNSRGWAGRLGNSSFRLGFLGVLKRNEADIGASGAFNRLNRFAEFDIIHQSWLFETGFLYRFTPDLNMHGKSGNFLAPFNGQVWIISMVALFAMNCVWCLVEWIKEIRQRKQITETSPPKIDMETSWSGLWLKTFAAICQQGMDFIPKDFPSRTIVLTVFLFALVMYNYYTSSVVGGLLSSTAQGPQTVDEVISSTLKLSFEDIGYYKVLFREQQSRPVVHRLYSLKVVPERNPSDMPVYLPVEDAIPFLRKGGYAFHCEVIDAYPQIAHLFDAEEICDLRMVTGLLESQVFNWDITKQSQYSEIFRIVMCRATEVGLVKRTLRQRRPKKPRCQALYRVFPIALSGVSSAFYLLAGGYLVGIIVLLIEKKVFKSTKIKADK